MSLKLLNPKQKPKLFWGALLLLVEPIYFFITLLTSSGEAQYLSAFIEPLLLPLCALLLLFCAEASSLAVPFGAIGAAYGLLTLYDGFNLFLLLRADIDLSLGSNLAGIVASVALPLSELLKFCAAAIFAVWFFGKAHDQIESFWWLPALLWLSVTVVDICLWSFFAGGDSALMMIFDMLFKNGATALSMLWIGKEKIQNNGN